MAVDIAALTKRKVAGIPVLYLLLGIGAVSLYGAIKMKASPAAPADATTPSTDTQDEFAGDLPDTSQPVFQATPVITQPTGTSVAGTAAPDTDDAWERRAIDYLRQNGYSIDVATSAITKYLAGSELNDTEKAARDMAVRVYGLPPEGVPDAPVPTTPAPSVPASAQGVPPLVHTVKGTSDDTFSELAKLYYGFGQWNSSTTALIASQNVGKSGVLPVGTQVKIPKLTTPKYYRATSAVRTVYTIAAKNGTTATAVMLLNPGVHWPARVGQSIRVK